jgi:hypothetical protein
MQGLRVVLDAMIAGLRSTLENSTGAGPTEGAPREKLNSTLPLAYA